MWRFEKSSRRAKKESVPGTERAQERTIDPTTEDF
jgi:hypothetical protein